MKNNLRPLAESYRKERGASPPRCEPCDMAAGIVVAEGLCKEFNIDCREFKEMLDNPGDHTLDDAREAVRRIRDSAEGEAQRKLSLVLCLMEGKPEAECLLEE